MKNGVWDEFDSLYPDCADGDDEWDDDEWE